MLLHYNFTSFLTWSPCIIGKYAPHVGKYAPHVGKTAMEIILTPTTKPLSHASTNVQSSINSLFFFPTYQSVSLLKRHTLNSRDFLQPLTHNRTVLFPKFWLLSTKRTSSYIASSRADRHTLQSSWKDLPYWDNHHQSRTSNHRFQPWRFYVQSSISFYQRYRLTVTCA